MKKYFLLLLITIFSFCILGCEQTPPDDKPNDDPIDDPIVDDPVVDDPVVENPTIDFTFDYEMYEIFEKTNPYTEDIEFFMYIGYYPQREIKDPAVLKIISQITETNERGYIEYDGYEIAKITVVNTHCFGDDPLNDESFYSGTQYVVGTTHYFLVEPICWRILNNPTEEELFLITEDIIDSRRFHDIASSYTNEDGVLVRPSDYEHSSIRDWLNNYFFYHAFNETEQSFIQDSYNLNDPFYIFNEPNELQPTIDKVFLLSNKEATSFSYGFFNPESRMAKASDFSRSKGLVNVKNEYSSSSNWWTRTGLEYTPLFPAMVKYDGSSDKNYYPQGENIGVRPAIKIILNQE